MTGAASNARAHGLTDTPLRGHSAPGSKAGGSAIEEPIESARWLVPLVLYPDREGTTFRESSWNVEPETPRITARAAFLTDGRAISYVETFLGLVEQHHLAPIARTLAGVAAGRDEQLEKALETVR